MKVVIFAGGFGTRISEESAVRPKPLVEIGDKPIIWHIMKTYAAHGLADFVICAGYKGYLIKEYFANYFLHMSDVTFDLERNTRTTLTSEVEPWRVTVIDTGEATMTGGRLKRVADQISDGTFCLTYGDCVADVDVGRLIGFHREQDAVVTLTAVQPPGRFGVLTIGEEDAKIHQFHEKPEGEAAGWVNGGFFVVEPAALDYIEDDTTVWEREPLERLAKEGKLAAYRHPGYWQPMDSLRDKIVLEQEWASGRPPWRVW
jgi:glucose-1-phosphate cytidylyltransferase